MRVHNNNVTVDDVVQYFRNHGSVSPAMRVQSPIKISRNLKLPTLATQRKLSGYLRAYTKDSPILRHQYLHMSKGDSKRALIEQIRVNANNSMKLAESKSKSSLTHIEPGIVNLLETPIESLPATIASPQPSTFRKTNLTQLEQRTMDSNSVPESPIPEQSCKPDCPLKSIEDFKDDFKMMPEILGKGAFAKV